MNKNRIISAALSLVMLAACLAPTVSAEGVGGYRIYVSYSVQADRIYGTPGILNPPQVQSPMAGEEFVLAEELETDATLGLNKNDGELYIGEWIFTGWTIPNCVSVREEISGQALSLTGEPSGQTSASTGDTSGQSSAPSDDAASTGSASDPDASAQSTSASGGTSSLPAGTEKRVICCSFSNVEFKGRWEFVPTEKLQIPTTIETADGQPLVGNSDTLDKFWPEREEQLNNIYSTGLFPESLILYMNENIREIPLQSKNFGSVSISAAERSDFMKALKKTYLATATRDDSLLEVESGVGALMTSTGSATADLATAYVVYTAGQAGLLEGQSKSLPETADLQLLYSYLRDESCADFLSADNLLRLYSVEDGEVSGEIVLNDSSVSFAAGEDWYDASLGKSSVLPGDLIIFKDENDTPVSIGIIDSVEGRSITYVQWDREGIPAEYLFDVAELNSFRAAGIDAEIIGLRSTDSSRIIYDFLVNEMELPNASALGVIGNLYYESKFSTIAIGDGNTSFGLCQWHNDRFLNLVIFCMKNNYNIASLEGQLRFLESELAGKYSELLAEMKQSNDDPASAYYVAGRFCKVFEQPAEQEMNSALRGTVASEPLWDSFCELLVSESEDLNMKLAEVQEELETAAAAEAMQPVPVSQSECIFYTVKEGDTLASICMSLGFDYANNRREVLALNNISNENYIQVGQTLIFWRSMVKTNPN